MLTKRNPITVAQAQKLMAEIQFETPVETVSTKDANGRVLAQDIVANYDYPHFRRSGMDGYAIREADDCNFPKEFKVLGEIQAGKTWDTPLKANECVRIMTGAFVPDDAQKVIRIEKTTSSSPSAKTVVINETERKDNITPVGADVKKGNVIIKKNSQINPGGIAVLTAFGIKEIQVYQKPRIALIATGTELLNADEEICPGKIYNSNQIMIKNLVEENGGIVDFEIQLPDEPDQIRKVLEEQIKTHDIVITDGGVSVGDFDYIGDAARKSDRLLFNKIKQRPGSVTTAFIQDNTLVMALSGNPGACFTGFYLYMEPLIRRLLHQESRIQKVRATLDSPYKKTNEYDRYLRATYKIKDGKYLVYPNGINRSGSLTNLQTTTCLILIPHGDTPLKVGMETDAWLLPFK